jgi:hypothetical protein
LLLCGLNHRKPSIQNATALMEAWIDGFSAQALGSPIIVNLFKAPTRLEEMDDELSIELYPEPERDEVKSSKPLNKKTETIFDTCTGSARPVDHKKDVVVKTSDESVGYVMQLLAFNNQRVLTFYDSGANQNIVQAKLARDAGFLQLSSKPVTIGVAGGGEIVTKHGQYMAILGPCLDGKSYSLDCQAVSQITRHFPTVRLSAIIEEAKTVMPSVTSFPFEIGGDEVKLLVGIRQTELAPRLILTLPSGVSVFESKVTDIFGSNICFGGPHQIFTDAYRTLGINLQVGSLQTLFTEVANAYLESPWAFVRDECRPFNDEKTLLEARDLEPLEFNTSMTDLALEIAPELALYQADPGELLLEERLSVLVSDQGDQCTNLATTRMEDPAPDPTVPVPDVRPPGHIDCYHSSRCDVPHSCYKALIPLSKLKGLMDEMDVQDVTDFRCDVCSNCTVCRMSARLKTKSLQESFEQEVIEKSVTLDPSNDQVLVNLPFVQDPVEYLTKKHGGPDNKRQALAVYRSQCMKSPEIKEQLRKTHQELVDQKFMCNIAELDPEKQDLIRNAEFQHFYLWRCVFKSPLRPPQSASSSTPRPQGSILSWPKGRTCWAASLRYS